VAETSASQETLLEEPQLMMIGADVSDCDTCRWGKHLGGELIL
jgi:hypothetical protein